MHDEVHRNYFIFFPCLSNDYIAGHVVCFRSGGMCRFSNGNKALILTDIHNNYLVMFLRQYILGLYICYPFF